MTHNIFAIELCLRLEPGNPLRAQLRELVVAHPAASTRQLKWELLKAVSERLLQNAHLFEKGCWDFFDDDGRALRDYEMWSKGMITEEGARPGPSGMPGTSGAELRYMTFTIALLLAAGTACARDLSSLCDIPQDKLWMRGSFMRILMGLPRVSFAAVKSDIFYLIPGDESWGLTAEDLAHSKFEYLRKVV